MSNASYEPFTCECAHSKHFEDAVWRGVHVYGETRATHRARNVHGVPENNFEVCAECAENCLKDLVQFVRFQD